MTNFQRARGFIAEAAPELLALAAALIFAGDVFD